MLSENVKEIKCSRIISHKLNFSVRYLLGLKIESVEMTQERHYFLTLPRSLNINSIFAVFD